MDYIESLNPSQKDAVINTEGPSMIIAGAGSGKTRVLTFRIANLIQKGVDPFNILSLTFTNKAAKEMRERIEKVVGPEARGLWMGTFHSVFARILRAEAEKIGYTSNFTIYDSDDSKTLIKQIVKEQYLDEKLYKPSTVLARISGAKNRLISAQEYLNNPHFMADDASAMRPEMGKLYKLYQDRCFKAGAMDFDDLLFNTNILFKNHIDVVNKYQNIFKYVLVDEFQDTNLSQYSITKKLSAKNRNICVVGDDAQSIYAFRGADIQNILNFEKDYPELQVYKLEQNYRSTKVIVNAANSVIGKNKAQLKKNVFTENETGKLIEIIKATSDNEEGRMVATAIFEEKMAHQLKNKDFAILYRTNSQSRAFEEALRRMNLKYKVVGGLSFYQRKEIKDLVAYLRFTLNPNDEQALRRIINYPKRGIGDTTVSKLLVTAEEQGASLWDVLNNVHSVIPGRAAAAIEGFVVQIKNYMRLAENKDAFETAIEVAQSSGILKELYEDKTVEGLSRYENVQELLNGIKEFVDNPNIEDKKLGSFLQEISLLTDIEEEKDKDNDFIVLMTIHSAKGLEFKSVYIVGMEEELFPSQMMLSSRADLEEERRLFYVAITRAQSNLCLSFAATRYRFGRLKECEPSRFLNELDPQYLNISRRARPEPSAAPTAATTSSSQVIKAKPKTASPVLSKPKSNYVPSPDFKPSDTSQLKAGMRVEHLKFGYGTVKAMDVSGTDRKAIIEFNDHGEKTLILSFAKLKIHTT
ncbi:MAG: UvrD-helicase domain-containing protein [Sporocytophaga sp.]|uniref:ATP-dependent helicase n=1 Tax=Sporocytophaga sp. TaxID=2231183 RepID=UPI001AFE99FB|nr:UvrD-helicase domain-containing protein [Sporocytophaga sp.]MBO9701218.1 UvrD-helicase domain-containing protein [Sporocytophaga sp.]